MIVVFFWDCAMAMRIVMAFSIVLFLYYYLYPQLKLRESP